MKSRFAITLAIVAAIALIGMMVLSLRPSGAAQAGAGPAANPIPAGAETFRNFAALASDQDRIDFQILAQFIERAGEDLSNVAHALVRNEVVGVAGVEYTGDQITAIQNAGLAAAWEMKEGYLALIAHAGVTPAQLDTFAANNPSLVDSVPVICANDPTVCPGYEPPTPTPTP